MAAWGAEEEKRAEAGPAQRGRRRGGGCGGADMYGNKLVLGLERAVRAVTL